MNTALLIDWHEATAELRSEVYAKAHSKALAEIQKANPKMAPKTQETQADNIAQAMVVKHIHKTQTVNGIENPSWNDPEWGYGTELTEKRETKKANANIEDLIEWLEAQDWSEFAQSIALQYRSKGKLSAKQIASAKKMRETMAAKAKAKKAAVKSDKPSGINLEDLPSGYYAVPGGTRLKVRVARPTKASKWHGWTFVSDGAEYGQRKNYGKQAPSGLYQGDIQTELEAILADPLEARKAFGKLWGQCGSCGRKLEDADSIAAGIGPICASKWEA